jgi:amino-acid N-acetyltransferase
LLSITNKVGRAGINRATFGQFVNLITSSEMNDSSDPTTTHAATNDAALAQSQFVAGFRSSAPYINAHRGETFVIQFSGATVNEDTFTDFVHDLVLLHALGIRLVLVPGAKPQIDARLAELDIDAEFVGARRVTDVRTLAIVKEVTGALRVEIEARLSMGLANSPSAGARIGVRSGNYVTARPIGVRDGTDYHYTGEVRRVDTAGLRENLDAHNIVLISPLGYSPTGEVFNVAAEEVATAVAAQLNAAKLILLGNMPGVFDEQQNLVRELTTEQAKALLSVRQRDPARASDQATRQLAAAVRACETGVTRTHILDARINGAMLLEAFTRDGIGTMVSGDTYDAVREATVDDVPGILALIEPLEADGILVRRSRDKLEQEITRFTVVERDGAVLACAALYPFEDTRYMELACLAVNPVYRNGERGDKLLAQLERDANTRGAKHLFVLTTRTAQWFMERGYKLATVAALPLERQAMYNFQRGSKVLMKSVG